MKRRFYRLLYNSAYALVSFIFIAASFSAYGQHVHDTTSFSKALAEKQDLVFSDSLLNTIGIDSLLNKIEYVHTTINKINNTTTYGFDTKDIDANFPEIDSSIDIIDANLSLYNRVLDVKNLQMFNVLLADMQDQLSEWRNSLFQYNKDLVSMNAQMNSFKNDAILTRLMADTAFENLYAAELTDLKNDWMLAQKATGGSLAKMNELQAQLSSEYFETIDLKTKVRGLLRKMGTKAMGQEYSYLWRVKNDSLNQVKQLRDLSKKSYEGQRRILAYYFQRNWDDQLWLFLSGLLFFIWVFRSFKILEKYSEQGTATGFTSTFIKKFSILATLIVMFTIAPFFDIHPPTAYVDIMEFFLVIALTLLLWRRWPKELFYCWLIIGLLYIVFSFTGTFLTPRLGFRLMLLAINMASIFFGLYWVREIKKFTLPFSSMIKVVSYIYIVLNFAAVLCNLFGRLSLAKVFSITAIYGLTQMVGLTVFIQIILEAFELQTKVNKLRGGITARLNFDRIERLLRRALILLSVCIWAIVFTISLNLYNRLFRTLMIFLNKPRNIGNTSFEIGNILLFIVIIYISNLLQQGIGSLYGKSESTWDPEVRKNGSRLAMTRLVLIIMGFLLAVAASGLPIDKITIVLGALGVGIGLGLQSIVNNLVSGVILIFEQPFRIGDYIELGDKKGRVLDIGIRSSKLLMEEGAEVIMPNGDLLSGRVINWTLRNDDVRVELPINVGPGQSFAELQQLITEVLKHSDSVLKNAPPEILLTAITDKAMSLRILVWINNVHQVQLIKSELLNKIYQQLIQHQIQLI